MYYFILNKPRVEPKQIIFSDENRPVCKSTHPMKPVAVVPPYGRVGFMKNKEASEESSGKCEFYITLLLNMAFIFLCIPITHL